MKKPKMNSGLISNSKNKKTNEIANQVKNLNNQPSNVKNASFRQILLKLKTQKCSPHKTPPKSLNKISVDKNIKNVYININLNKNMSKTKLINHEINNIIYNINNNNNKISMNKNNENNKNSVFHNNKKIQKNFYNKSTKDSPRIIQSNSKNFIDRTLNSNLSMINKNHIREKVIVKDDGHDTTKNQLNLNINVNQFKVNKNNKV